MKDAKSADGEPGEATPGAAKPAVGKTAGDRSAGKGKRLQADAWTKAALTMLATEGSNGVRVDSLARRLNVTKGSFYWHFRDRDALLDAMLDHWRRTATLELIDRLDTVVSDPRARLVALLALSTRDRNSAYVAEVELSIRLWGRTDPRAKVAMAEIDELRTRYITRLLRQCGIDEQAAQARAILAYAYMRVAATLIDKDNEALMSRCEAVLLGEADT